MHINYIVGINGDRVNIKVLNDLNKEIFKEEYVYGVNASYDKKMAEYAKKRL